jgi:adenine-specific DNA-methyltransferase
LYTLYFNFKEGFAILITRQDYPVFEKENISLTKTIETFNESCTIKYNNKSIAEVQSHSSRNCVKFRFSMKNMATFLETKHCSFSKTNFKVRKNLGTFNYIGSKTKLLHFLKNEVESYINRPLNTVKDFFDIFSGTGVVSSYFAENGCKKIVTNDNMYYSYILSSSLTDRNVDTEKIKKEINFMNEHLVGIDTGYIYNTYAVSRMYFTPENAKKIDVILMYLNSRIDFFTKEEYNLLLKILLYASTKVANISSTYGAYLKKFKKNSLQPLNLYLKSVDFLLPYPNVKISSYCMNVIDFVKSIDVSGDICYLDPPYNSRKYSSNYFILESIARNHKPIVSNGVTGVPLVEPFGSSIFCSKATVKQAFSTLFSHIKTKYIFISYNSESLLSRYEMVSLLENTGWINIKVVEKDYKRFKSNVNSGKTTILEYLFCATNSFT